MAAGLSRRYQKGNKLLALYQGKPLIHYALASIQQCLGPNVSASIVGGCDFQAIEAQAELFGIPAWENIHYKNGLSSSLQVGVKKLPSPVKGVLIVLMDMPFIRKTDLKPIIDAAQQGDQKSLLLSSYQGKVTHPKYIGAAYFKEILQLKGDEGAKKVFQKYENNCVEIPLGHSNALIDFDFESDFE